MKVHREFSKHAAVYGERNVIQREVAQKLLSLTHDTPRRILDLGCGSGTLFSYLNWEFDYFVGVDFSSQMLSFHPRNAKIELLEGNFNDPLMFEAFRNQTFDRIYSASALQWGSDLKCIFEQLRSLNTPLSLALFTSGTFKSLHECAQLPPLLRSADEVIGLAEEYFDASYDIATYTLSFDSVREMFRYIKRSGVSGGEKRLSVSEMKRLMENYPLTYLEFEVVFITTE